MAIRIVQSKQNARVKELRSALLRPGKSPGETVGIEGIHLVGEALRSGLAFDAIFVAQGHESLMRQLGGSDSWLQTVEVLALPAEVLASAVTTDSPQPVAALVRPRSWQWGDILGGEVSRRALVVVLAGVQDPGNLGTILRSAEAFGATGAVCLPGTVSPWNPKAVRASAGSVFRLPFLDASAETCFLHLTGAGVASLATLAREAESLERIDLSGPVAIFIGSEGAGLSPEIAAQCGTRITIPCPGPVESLNAAVAASVLLYEAARQRRAIGGRP